MAATARDNSGCRQSAKNMKMDNSPHNISKALLDLASVSETVLTATAKGRAVLKDPKLEFGHRTLLERVDGFRSIEQLLSMSGDIIGMHAVLGKLLATGCVATESGAVVGPSVVPIAEKRPVAASAKTAAPPVAPVKAPAPVPPKASAHTAIPPRAVSRPMPAKPALVPAAVPAPASARATGPAHVPTELDNAKRLLFQEAKAVLGNGAAKLKPRIDACNSIEDIYDLIVKFQEHLAATGKADPSVFLDRLTRGLAAARQHTGGAKLQAAE